MMFHILIVAASMMIGGSACAMEPSRAPSSAPRGSASASEGTALVILGEQVPGGYQATIAVYPAPTAPRRAPAALEQAPAALEQAPVAPEQAQDDQLANADFRCTDKQVACGGLTVLAAYVCCLFCGGK